MNWKQDLISTSVRFAAAMSRQGFYLGLALHIESREAALLFKILAINSIFSLIIGGERYYSVITKNRSEASAFKESFLAGLLLFIPYTLTFLTFIASELSTKYYFLITIAYGAALFDAMANIEQKVHTLTSSSPFSDLKLNVFRNILPILIAILFYASGLKDWLVCIFLAPSLLTSPYIRIALTHNARSSISSLLDRNQINLIFSSLMVRANVFADRILIGKYLGDQTLVSLSLIQSAIATVGAMIDMTYSRRVVNIRPATEASYEADIFVRARYIRQIGTDMLRTCTILSALWLLISLPLAFSLIFYKTQILQVLDFTYFVTFFLYSAFIHFFGILAINIKDPSINISAPLTRFVLVCAGLAFTQLPPLHLEICSIIAIFVTFYKFTIGFDIKNLVIAIPFARHRVRLPNTTKRDK